MEISRKDFIKGAAGGASLLLLQPAAPVLAEDSQTQAGLAMLIDVTKCVNCWWCYAACKNYNNLNETMKPDMENPPELAPDVWTTLYPVKKGGEWVSRKKACNHCTNAACVEVCPTGALSYNKQGFVQYDREKCSGCGYCAEFCPFGIPRMETAPGIDGAIMNKCTFCQDRVANGEPTACAAACTTGAITFGARQDLVTQGKARVNELQVTKPDAMMYGADELDGLHVMYVLDGSPEEYGLPTEPEVPPSSMIRTVLSWLGSGLAIAILAGFGLNYLVARLRMRKTEEK
jgi:formate dehydrogenase iron-sulfur subunit